LEFAVNCFKAVIEATRRTSTSPWTQRSWTEVDGFYASAPDDRHLVAGNVAPGAINKLPSICNIKVHDRTTCRSPSMINVRIAQRFGCGRSFPVTSQQITMFSAIQREASRIGCSLSIF
jgi:hypothetical protein